MKAVVCRSYGGIDAARLETVAPPALRGDGVRIAVKASCASFASLLVMRGEHQNRAEPPFTPGTEVAGVVLEAGDAAKRFRPGDRVIAAVRSGGYAEQVVVPEETVFALPDAIPYTVGSTLPSVYGTAYAGLAWRAHLSAGETVLVHGAAGGSGMAAIDIAKALGARVIASAGTPEKCAGALDQGAHEAIDYRASDLRDSVLKATGGRGVDVVYDPVGGEAFTQSLRCMAPEGRLVSVGFASGTTPQAPANILLVKNLDVIGLYWGHYLNWGRQPVGPEVLHRVREVFDTITGWIVDGRFSPRIHACVELTDFARALRIIERREAIGRVVLV